MSTSVPRRTSGEKMESYGYILSANAGMQRSTMVGGTLSPCRHAAQYVVVSEKGQLNTPGNSKTVKRPIRFGKSFFPLPLDRRAATTPLFYRDEPIAMLGQDGSDFSSPFFFVRPITRSSMLGPLPEAPLIKWALLRGTDHRGSIAQLVIHFYFCGSYPNLLQIYS